MTQEVSFPKLVHEAQDSELALLVPEAARSLLSILDQSVLTGDRLRQLIVSGDSVNGYLMDPARRSVLLKMLPATKAKVLIARLGLSAELAPHQTLHRYSSELSPRQVAELLSFFGASETSQARRPSSAVQNTRANYPLFKHQRDAMGRVQAALQKGNRRVVLHMPTGSGKTRTAMNIIAEHLRNHEPTVVVWLASTSELLEQAASEFESAWSYLGNRNVDIIRHWGNRTAELANMRDGLLVTGLGKLSAAAKRNINLVPMVGDATSLVVMDEAHQSIATTYSQLLQTLSTKRPTTSLLGLTATPGRSYNDISQDKVLADFWTGEKVMLEVDNYGSPVTFLIEEGYLARPKFRTVNAAPGFELGREDIQRLQGQLELSEQVIERLGRDAVWNLAVVNATIDLLSRHRRVIVFSTTKGQAIMLASVMRGLGHNSRAITGDTPSVERSNALQLFTSGSDRPMAIFNFGVLTTGFDAPATSAVVVARPTKSLVLFSQMVGRALRGPRAGGNDEAEIVTVLDPALPGFGDPVEAFTNWEDVW